MFNILFEKKNKPKPKLNILKKFSKTFRLVK